MILKHFVNFFLSPIEAVSGNVGLVDGSWGIRLDPLTVGYIVCCFILIGKVVIVLQSFSQLRTRSGWHRTYLKTVWA